VWYFIENKIHAEKKREKKNAIHVLLALVVLVGNSLFYPLSVVDFA
jgi:hypothetical protein